MRGILSTLLIAASILTSANPSLGHQPPERPEPNPRYWQDSASGRLYWNKALPAYLFLSSTPTPLAGTAPLNGQGAEGEGTPFFFDTEGINYLRTRWAVNPTTGQTIEPKREILWPVWADGIPPKSIRKVVYSDPSAQPNDTTHRHVLITLEATDAMSGVEMIYYSLNGQPYEPYLEPIRVEEEGEFTLYYYAEDHVGNQEPVREYPFTTDFTPPQTQHHVLGFYLPSSNTLSKKSRLTLSAQDEKGKSFRIFYRLDSGAWTQYSQGKELQLSSLKDGKHTLEYYSVDAVGNQEIPSAFHFYYDILPPITTSEILGDKFLVEDKIFFSGRTKLKIIAVDNHAGVQQVGYSIDGAPFTDYTTPFYIPQEPGWHVVRYFSIDSTENKTVQEHTGQVPEYRMKVDKIYVDLTGPTITHTLEGPAYTRNDTLFVAPTTRIALKAHDTESGLKGMTYAIDRESFEKEYRGPFTLEGFSSGAHYLELFAYDNVGNRNVDVANLLLDEAPPTARFHVSVRPIGHIESQDSTGTDPGDTSESWDPGAVYPVDATIYLSAQDVYTGVKRLSYSLNGEPTREYKQPFKGLQKGENRLRIVTEDLVGNRGEQVLRIRAQ